ncbi:MAG: hypothetical protein AAGE89_01690 [Pseudomonadota bacterium]
MVHRVFMATLLTLGATVGTVHAAERFHSIEKMCVEYEMKGQMMNGTIARCHRKHAFEWFEIRDLKTGFGGFTQRQYEHSIAIGDTMYAINPEAGTGTITKNPMYKPFQEALQRSGNRPEAIGQVFFDTMGFQPSGKTKTIAGYQCQEMVSQSAGSMCFTDDFVMLEQSILGNSQVAVKVTMGADGGSENYDLWQKVSLSQGPDLSDGFDLESLARQQRELGAGADGGTGGNGGIALPEGMPELPKELQDMMKQLQQLQQ